MTQVVGFWPKIRRLGSLIGFSNRFFSGRILHIWTEPKSDDLGSSDFQIEIFPVGFCIFGLHKQGHSFFEVEKYKSEARNRTA